MIDIVPVVPTEENAIAVAIAAGSMPMTIWYGVDTISGEIEWTNFGSISAPSTVQIETLVPSTWYAVMAVDSSGSPSKVIRMMPRQSASHFKIDLLRESIQTKETISGRSNCFRMRVEAKNPVNLLDAGIFLYWADGNNPPVFQAVCKPSDLEAYELDGTALGFSRKDYVDVLETSLERLEEDWDAIWTDVDVLLENLNRNRQLDRDVYVQVTGDYNRDCLQDAPISESSSSSL
jgi:hypothetical protein